MVRERQYRRLILRKNLATGLVNLPQKKAIIRVVQTIKIVAPIRQVSGLSARSVYDFVTQERERDQGGGGAQQFARENQHEWWRTEESPKGPHAQGQPCHINEKATYWNVTHFLDNWVLCLSSLKQLSKLHLCPLWSIASRQGAKCELVGPTWAKNRAECKVMPGRGIDTERERERGRRERTRCSDHPPWQLLAQTNQRK